MVEGILNYGGIAVVAFLFPSNDSFLHVQHLIIIPAFMVFPLQLYILSLQLLNLLFQILVIMMKVLELLLKLLPKFRSLLFQASSDLCLVVQIRAELLLCWAFEYILDSCHLIDVV